MSDEAFRERLLQSMEPIIPFDTPITEHPYICVEAGPTGRYPDLNYVVGEIYYIKKSRWSKSMVEIRGPLYKAKPNYIVTFKHHFPVPIDNCKKCLKRYESRVPATHGQKDRFSFDQKRSH